MTETSLCRLNILTRYDHYPLLISTSEETELEAPPGPWSCQNVNWESFPYMLYLETTSQAAHADPTAEWAHLLEALKNAVARSQKAREGGRPRKRVHRNRWWNKECVEAAEAKLAAFEVALERNQHVAQDSRRAVAHQDDEYKKACRRLTHTNKKAKRKAVTDAVGELNSAREWQVMAVIRKKTKSPNILSPPFWLAGRVSATGAADKAKLLLSTIFPSAVQVEGSERSGMQLDVEEGTNEVGDVGVPRDGTIARLDYDERGSTEPMEETDEVPPILPHVKESELDGAIKGLKSGKAAGRDGLGPGLLKKAYHLSPVFKTRLLRLVDICVTEARFPEQWKVAATRYSLFREQRRAVVGVTPSFKARSPVHRLKLLRAAIFSALDYRAELHPLIPESLPFQNFEQEHRASIFVDGAKGAASEDAGGLGAAAVGFSNSSPARKWTVKERLDGSIWTVVEAELYAILIGLRSCLGGFWKRIDILSDSQVALHRLSAGYTNDRTKPGHQDIELHDEADAAAKLAARMPMPLSIDDPALRVVREQFLRRSSPEPLFSDTST
ncbi:hypothetical protein [Sporisorium scitamineum]|uniref:Uncharacterized protein n=1 Tax=Sporisorium scitamineum TaxID=49012 RepID=A0A0F7S830_9BASI|nr:hypothetical protein [Sporisorium scitamineum]